MKTDQLFAWYYRNSSANILEKSAFRREEKTVEFTLDHSRAAAIKNSLSHLRPYGTNAFSESHTHAHYKITP